MVREMACIAVIVDRFPGIVLQHKLTIDKIANCPHFFSIEAAPLMLPSGALLECSRSSNALTNNMPVHRKFSPRQPLACLLPWLFLCFLSFILAYLCFLQRHLFPFVHNSGMSDTSSPSAKPPLPFGKGKKKGRPLEPQQGRVPAPSFPMTFCGLAL